MTIEYEVRTHGLSGMWRWWIEVRPAEKQLEHPQRPLLAEITQSPIEQPYVTREAAERAGEAFLAMLAGSPPRV